MDSLDIVMIGLFVVIILAPISVYLIFEGIKDIKNRKPEG